MGASDHGTTKSLYAKDPDGIEFEVAWIVPADLLDEAALASRSSIGRLDIDREKRRYGASTLGGVGISRLDGCASRGRRQGPKTVQVAQHGEGDEHHGESPREGTSSGYRNAPTIGRLA